MPAWLVTYIHKHQPRCKLQIRFAHTQRLLPFIKTLNGMERLYALRMDQWSLPRHAFQTLCSSQDLAELVIENKVDWYEFDEWKDSKPLRLKSFEIMGRVSRDPGNFSHLYLFSALLTKEKHSGFT